MKPYKITSYSYMDLMQPKQIAIYACSNTCTPVASVSSSLDELGLATNGDS